MGAAVTYSHDDIDPNSIQPVSFGHDDIDQSSIQTPDDKPSPSWLSIGAKALNSVALSPVEAAISAAQNGKDPFQAYKNQFANMKGDAPTGTDIAAKAGLSTDNSSRNIYMNNPQGGAPILQPDLKGKSNAELGGMVIDQAANPLNYAGPALSLAGKAIEPVTDAVAGGLRSYAENTAVNATGATGKQASTFAQDAGRQLLDRGIVKFGSSQKNIAQSAANAVDEANSQIDSALSKLDANGTKVNAQDIYDTVRTTINKMKADPSKAIVASKLEGELNHIIEGTDATGSTKYGMQEAENIKRGYGQQIKNWAQGQAAKELYQTYRDAVENAGTAADPATTQAFKEGKQTYGLLSPIEEAAARRAAVTNQHQTGGLLDATTAIIGEHAAGPLGAIAIPVGRRVIMPRLASSLAVTADQGANMLSNIPKAVASAPAAPVAANVSQSLAPAADVMQKAAGNQNQPQQPQPAPTAKGMDKWAADGMQTLKAHVSDDDRAMLEKYSGQFMLDPKAKNLLITASNFQPGSKPLDDILKHLKARVGEK